MIKKIVKVFWEKINLPMRLKIVRAAQTKFTVSVAAIIVNENAEVLLLDHVLRSDLSWGIPGGFVDYGEQPEDAVRREIREETGLELREPKIIRVRTIGRHLEVLFLASPVGAAKARSLEINELGWFKVAEMPEKMSRAQKQIIEKVLNSEYKNPIEVISDIQNL